MMTMVATLMQQQNQEQPLQCSVINVCLPGRPAVKLWHSTAQRVAARSSSQHRHSRHSLPHY